MGLTYKDAGVDIEAGDALVDTIKQSVRRTHGPGVMAGIGGFASLFSLADRGLGLEDPVLVSGTDGVGTKLRLAFRTNRHDTIGIDLVAMCVNDIVTSGATPLFFLDYFGTGHLETKVAESVIAGIATGCERAGCALVGGETAEMPGMYADGEYDLAGFAVGVVERAKIIDGRTVTAGDVVIGVASRGLHSNGYSLAQAALFDRAALPLDDALADELLEPTAIYTLTAANLVVAAKPRALAHITGGGIGGNLPRVLPDGVIARVDRTTWPRPPIFDRIRRAGDVADDEMYRTFNMGLGLIAVVPGDAAQAALRAVEDAGERGFLIGTIDEGEGAARVEWA